MNIRFDPGRCCATPAAIHELAKDYVLVEDLLHRHVNCDWGDVSNSDRMQNEVALVECGRIVSYYRTDEVKIYIVTEADRSVTTVMLVEEY